MKFIRNRASKIFILLVLILLNIFFLFLIVSADEGEAYPNYLDTNNIKTNIHNSDFYTGMSIYNYSIKIPKGTNNLQPKLELDYSSFYPSQKPITLGTGWDITSFYIQRDTNYTFSNYLDDEFILNFNGQIYDLVYVPGESR